MTPEKDAKLCEKYPKIFRDRFSSPRKTCMSWGFECGDGWYDIIDALCLNIQHEVDWLIQQQAHKLERGDISPEEVVPEEDIQVVATQVKEKFGGLRFYVSGVNDKIQGMISMAESMSYRTCETCGNPGKSSNDGWVVTLCKPCRDDYDRRRAEKLAPKEDK